MIDTDSFRVLSKIVNGYDPNTGQPIGQNGLQIDQKISTALSRVLSELRRNRPKKADELTDEEMRLFNKLKG